MSHLAGEIEAARLPLSGAAREAIGERRERLVAAITGGDDYEILFTAPRSAAESLDRLAAELGVPITAIGHMVSAREPAVTVRDEKGDKLPLASEGWTHF